MINQWISEYRIYKQIHIIIENSTRWVVLGRVCSLEPLPLRGMTHGSSIRWGFPCVLANESVLFLRAIWWLPLKPLKQAIPIYGLHSWNWVRLELGNPQTQSGLTVAMGVAYTTRGWTWTIMLLDNCPWTETIVTVIVGNLFPMGQVDFTLMAY